MQLPKSDRTFRPLNTAGLTHYVIPLVLVVSLAVAGVFSLVSSRANDLSGATSAVAKSSIAKHKLKLKRVNPKSTHKTGASVQFIVQEKVVDPTGKATMIPRGNVPVSIEDTTKNLKQRCRDGAIYQGRNGSVVFSGQTDALKANKGNLGKIKAEFCTSGKYTAHVNPAVDKYDVVGPSSKAVTIGKKAIRVTFVITKKGQPAPIAEAATQDTQPVDPGLPVTSPGPISAAEELAAIDKTSKFEEDMFFLISKTCQDATDDLGDTPANRISKFAKNSASYMTNQLIAVVNTKYGGDAFPLLGISDLHCGQFKDVGWQETAPIVASSAGDTAVVEHTFTATARPVPYGNYIAAIDIHRKWTFNLVREGDAWHIDSIGIQ